MVKIVQITQGYYGDLAGCTVEEVVAMNRDREGKANQAAKDRGVRRSPGMAVVTVKEVKLEDVPRCPWGHEQYVVNGNDVLGPRQATWDSSGQAVIEYAILTAVIALGLLGGIAALVSLI